MAAAAEKWSEAERLASASLRLRSSVEAARVLLSASEAAERPRLLHVARGVFFHPDAVLDDRVRAIRICLDYEDAVMAAQLLARLDADERETPAVQYETVRFLLKIEKYDEALQTVDQHTDPKQRPELDLLIASELADSKNSGARGVISERLDAVFHNGDHETALRALRILGSLPDSWISEPLARSALGRFREDPDLSVSDRLWVDLLKIGVGDGDRKAIIDSAVAAYRDSALTVLVPWLERLGEHERVVDLTDPAGRTAEMGSELFQSRARALGLLGRYEELEKELLDPPAEIADIPLLCCRAILATQQEKRSHALLLWQEAMERAERDATRNWFYYISDRASLVGNEDLEMEAMARGIEGRFGRPPPTAELAGLITWLYEHHETKRLLDVSYRLLQREPRNPLLINNYYYLKALHGTATREDLEVLKELVAAIPDEPGFASSLAFAHLELDEPAEAIQVLDELDTDERPRSEQAIRAAALSALEQREASFAIAANIDWDKFSTEEATVLRSWIER